MPSYHVPCYAMSCFCLLRLLRLLCGGDKSQFSLYFPQITIAEKILAIFAFEHFMLAIQVSGGERGKRGEGCGQCAVAQEE